MDKETRLAIQQEVKRQFKQIEEKILAAKEIQDRANKAILELKQSHAELLVKNE